MNSREEKYCKRCRRSNHSGKECWYNRFCTGCNMKGHSDEECAFRNRDSSRVNGMTDEISDNFCPLILFNVTTEDGEPISEVIADSGAGISAITHELAEKMGAQIEDKQGTKIIWQADGSQFSFSGISKVRIF